MRLRTRVMVVVALAFAVLTGVLFSVNGLLAVRRFRQLEDAQVADQVGRLRALLGHESDDLAGKLSDWSSWEDSWRFLDGSYPDFPAQQLTPSALSGNGIEVMLFLGQDGAVRHRVVAAGAGGAARSAALQRLVLATPALRPLTPGGVAAGYLALDEGLVLVAARPVLHGDGRGPAAGTLVWVRDITAERQARMAAALHSEMALWRLADAPAACRAQLAGDERGIQPGDRIAGVLAIDDVFGRPTLVGRVIMPRLTWLAGMDTVWWQAATSILALAATALGAMWLLDHLVGRRVVRLARQTADGDHAGSTIRMEGDDEIADLARQIEDLRNRLSQARDGALQAAESKATFLATMSHEIRTPLNGVIGMAQLLSRTRLDAEQQEYIGIVSSSADALLVLLNDILDFSKIEAGRIELEHVSYRLPTVLGDAAVLMAGRAQDKGLDLILDFAPDLPENVVGDPGRLRQVVTNLVSNAVKFTDSGHIRVGASAVPDGDALDLVVVVEDTGMGMDAEACGRLFRPFVQAAASISRTHGGTGLGLAISKRLIDLMGGTITVDSTPGVGSRFTIRVRVGVDPDAPTPVRPDLQPGSSVLILSAQPALAGWLGRMATAWGGVPRIAAGPEAMREALTAPRPGLVILDRPGPGEDVAAMVGALGATWPDLPVVLLSPPDLHGAPAGTVLVRKPVRRERLVQACRSVLQGEVPHAAPAIAPGSASSRFTGTVLLVDDHPINRRLGCVLLAKLGVEVHEATNGALALQAFAARDFDLVLMDCFMPVMDGFEATRALRAQQQAGGRHTPVVALTAGSSTEDRDRCLAAGMDDFLPKPLREDELVAMLRRHLQAATAVAAPAHAAAAPAGATAAVIDPETRRMLTGMPGNAPGANLFTELVAHFRSEFPQRFDDLVHALLGADAVGVRQRAHGMRGSCLSIGFAQLGGILAEIESAARAGDMASAVQALPEIERAWQAVLDHLAQEGGRPT